MASAGSLKYTTVPSGSTRNMGVAMLEARPRARIRTRLCSSVDNGLPLGGLVPFDNRLHHVSRDASGGGESLLHRFGGLAGDLPRGLEGLLHRAGGHLGDVLSNAL